LLAPLHAFELQPVGVEEEHRVIVVVILACGIDDFGAEVLEEALQIIDIPAAPQLKRVVVKADVTDAVFALLALGVRRADPEPRLAVGPPDGVVIFVEKLKTEELEQPTVERLRFLEIADPYRDVVDADDTSHSPNPSISRLS
jgi:hypothetical protein